MDASGNVIPMTYDYYSRHAAYSFSNRAWIPLNYRSEFSDQSSDFRYIFDDLQRSSRCCGVESPLDYNGSFWQRTETEYFLDYERRALNTSLDEDHVDIDETNHHHPHDEEELDSEDLLLPWSCCEVHFLRQEEEKERQQSEPEALANTIRHRLQSKSQVDRVLSNTPCLL